MRNCGENAKGRSEYKLHRVFLASKTMQRLWDSKALISTQLKGFVGTTWPGVSIVPKSHDECKVSITVFKRKHFSAVVKAVVRVVDNVMYNALFDHRHPLQLVCIPSSIEMLLTFQWTLLHTNAYVPQH